MTRLILLGTMGGARVVANRANSSCAIVVDGVIYVIDCGSGVARQLVRAGLRLKDLSAIFITHHHDDHNIELGNLLQAARMSGLEHPVRAYGPPPLAEIVRFYLKMNEYTFRHYAIDRTPLEQLIDVREIDEGSVIRGDNVKVRSVANMHPPIPSFAYRFETRDRVITVSGDTTPYSRVTDLARNSDVLVHEAMHRPSLKKLSARLPHCKDLVKSLLASHTTSEQAGKVARDAGVNTLVITHLIPGDDDTITDEMWKEGPAKWFKGKILIGKDLMKI